jgi:hypothetical protein
MITTHTAITGRGENGDAASTKSHVTIADLPMARACMSGVCMLSMDGTYLASLSDRSVSSDPYEVDIADGGLAMLARYVVVSRRAWLKSKPPTLRKYVGTFVAMPTVYSVR